MKSEKARPNYGRAFHIEAQFNKNYLKTNNYVKHSKFTSF